MKPNIFLTSEFKVIGEQLLPLLGNDPLKVIFITTAAELQSDPHFYRHDMEIYRTNKAFDVTEYTVTGKTEAEVREELATADVIHVVGGNTIYLLLAAQKSGLHKIVQEHIAAGKMYVGQSAGSIIAGPSLYPARRSDHGDDLPEPANYDGFGIVDFVVLPHWGKADRREVYQGERFNNTFNEDYKYLFLNDYQYVICTGDKISVIDVRLILCYTPVK